MSLRFILKGFSLNPLEDNDKKYILLTATLDPNTGTTGPQKGRQPNLARSVV